ncbi:unnamed protein product [Effrenium voratum]|uniref:DNA polymerase n=1 Tax=Effrenium voratum TaxID=2562239 RepID=A0AA36I1D7_9DINO|nr:unnamed protein product [Effrenium voratum]
MDTLQDLAAAAVASWEVEDDTGWRPCDDEVLQSLRVAGAGRKRRVTCNVRGRSCELDLDAKTETDTATGKRRRLRIAGASEAETRVALAACGSTSGTASAAVADEGTRPPDLTTDAAGAEQARVKKTLSGYFTKTREGREPPSEVRPAAPATAPRAPIATATTAASAAAPVAASPASPAGGTVKSEAGDGADLGLDPKTGNERIASIFEEMSAVQKLRRDRFRSQAYAKAALALRSLLEPIASGAQAKAIKGIGAGMAHRIDVILETGELKELEELKKDSDVVALRELRSVHGIGAVRAAELVERGVRSLAQLREAVAKHQVHLDAAQALGLHHCEEFRQRIPQAEMKEHHRLLEVHLDKENPSLLLTICGSYRRGRPDCGDIDVLISHPEYTTTKRAANAGGKLLHGFVDSLKRAGYVTGDLAFGNTKFMGICRLPGAERLHRRLDIRCVPYDQYHFGMLYFTGSAALSVKMRLKAIEMGLTLSEYGLENKLTGEKVLANSEEDIFRALGMPYLAPTER